MYQYIEASMTRLWSDDRAMHSPESMLIMLAVTVIGSIVGLATLRDHVVQQFGDAAVALDHLNQSYSFSFSRDGNGDGDFNDDGDFNVSGSYLDDSPNLRDRAGQPPGCMNLSLGPSPER